MNPDPRMCPSPTALIALLLFLAPPFGRGAGLDLDKLSSTRSAMERFVADGTIAGSVTLVGQRNGLSSLEAVGYSDLGARTPMLTNSVFWIASMTKPITAMAVLMLQDEGKLSVDDPVEKHLPEFQNQPMVEARPDGRAVVRSPRPITLRDLLTHTSGLADAAAPSPSATLAEVVALYAREPLRFAPGSKWEYCNSGINTLGRIVERASGKDFAAFLEERIFRPLSMSDTTFWLNPDQARRLAKSYRPQSGGTALEEAPIFFIKGDLADRSRTPFPAGGLFSTATDLFQFYRMVLNGGMAGSHRLVSAALLEQMTQPQTGQLKTGFVDGMSFGYGFAVVKEPAGVTGVLSRGSFGHGGAYGTQSWADRSNDLILILMIQRAGLPNADDSSVRRAFQEAAVAALR